MQLSFVKTEMLFNRIICEIYTNQWNHFTRFDWKQVRGYVSTSIDVDVNPEFV